uniref:CSON011033 protein n=1 Tax=Culicoides sonorensis TaxID=179676 RepID=A0A336N2C3_CULSO
MSKAAIDQFTKCCALDLAEKGVRVNAINPGVIVTDIHRRSGMDEKSYEEYLERSKGTHAMGRVGTVDEVVEAVGFLASNEKSSFITGACLPIDGGKHAMCPLDAELAYFDLAMIKRLAFQRLQQIALEHPEAAKKCREEKSSDPLSEIINRDDATIPKEEKTNSELNVESSVKVNGDTNSDLRSLTMDDKSEEKIRSVSLDLERQMAQTQIRSRAVLIPVNDILNGDRWYTDVTNLEEAIHMRYRSISIGTGIGNDLNLLLHGKCCRASNKHAVIFYDEITRYYELLNYSEFGTEVNGQLYSLNLKKYKPLPPPGVPDSVIKSNEEAEKNAQEIIDKRRKINREKYGLDENATMPAPPVPICKCLERPYLCEGWEGTALLSHGSLLKFGCISFVFSIVDYDSGIEDL